jgi:hypothetical protein
VGAIDRGAAFQKTNFSEPRFTTYIITSLSRTGRFRRTAEVQSTTATSRNSSTPIVCCPERECSSKRSEQHLGDDGGRRHR